MKHLKKLNFVVLPLAIWAITVIYVLLNKFIGTFTQNMEPSPVILTILVLIFNLGLQLLIICASTIYAVKKLDLTLKRVVISLPILYLLFGLFSPPSIYLFVFSNAILESVYFHNCAIRYRYADNNADCLQKEVCK